MFQKFLSIIADRQSNSSQLVENPSKERKTCNKPESIFFHMLEWIRNKDGELLALFLMATLVLLSTSKYSSLSSSVYDLGMFQSNLYQISFLDRWEGLFHGHIQPFLFVWAFLYKIFPLGVSTFILLSLQAITLTIPAWFLAKRYGLFGVAAFALYFPLWYNALFDFHTDHLAVPLLFSFFFLVEQEKVWKSIIPALLLILVKEPYALQTAACGIFLMMHNKRILPGVILLTSGLLYFKLATGYLIPYFSLSNMGPGIGSPPFAWLGNTLTEIATTLATKPDLVIRQILQDNGKINYLIITFGALGFIPLFRPIYLIPALPIFALSLLAIGKYHGIQHHYTAGILPPLIIAFLKGHEAFRHYLQRKKIPLKWFSIPIFAILIAANIRYSPSPISIKFWSSPGNSYHYTNYLNTNRDQQIKQAIETFIPQDPHIVVSTQNSLNWGILSNREFYFGFPKAVFQPSLEPDWSERSLKGFFEFVRLHRKPPSEKREIWSDYVVLDLKRAWFIIDRGCHFIHGECRNKNFSEKFQNLLEQTKKSHEKLYDQDGFMIYKRKSKGVELK